MKVSVIIPYNTDRGYLHRAIQSVYNQTYGNIEIIKAKSDANVSTNANNGIAEATGDIIKFLADDDWLPDRAIEYIVNEFKTANGKDYDFIHGIATNMHDNRTQEVIKPECKYPTLTDLLRRNYIHGGSVAYRKEFFEKFGGFDQELWTGEEFEMHLRALSMGAKIGYVDLNVYFYWRWRGQKSTTRAKGDAYKARRVEAIKQIRNKYRQ